MKWEGLLFGIWTLARNDLIRRWKENETLKSTGSPNGTAGVVLTKDRQICVVK